MPFSNTAKHVGLDAIAANITAVGIHTGDPGSAGTSNEVSGGGYARQTPSFAASASGEKALSGNLTFSGPAATAATWFSMWAGSTFYGRGQITTGDTAFNASGQYILTTGTKLRLTDS